LNSEKASLTENGKDFTVWEHILKEGWNNYYFIKLSIKEHLDEKIELK
jgi:hypothetical protein